MSAHSRGSLMGSVTKHAQPCVPIASTAKASTIMVAIVIRPPIFSHRGIEPRIG